MLKLQRSNAFKRDFKKYGEIDTALIEVLYLLLNGEPLPQKYKDHELIGNHKGFRECHIKPKALSDILAVQTMLKFEPLAKHHDKKAFDYLKNSQNMLIA